eukprot:SAG31_NODE_3963_length_3716_cov_3.038430_2_plen_200_part_00
MHQASRDLKVTEMLHELQIRCHLTTAQINQLSLQLVSHVSRGEKHINFSRFVEIAKSVGLERPDMEFYNKMYSVIDTNNSNSVDFEELCVGLSYFGSSNVRNKLRLLYQTWSLHWASGNDVDHDGHYEVGLSKFDIFAMLSTLIGSSHEVLRIFFCANGSLWLPMRHDQLLRLRRKPPSRSDLSVQLTLAGLNSVLNLC